MTSFLTDSSPIRIPLFSLTMLALAIGLGFHSKSQADTYAYCGSSVIWGKKRDDGSNSWRWVNPTDVDKIHWIDGNNRADAESVGPVTKPSETKFDHSDDEIAGKNYAQLNERLVSSSGTWVRTRAWGGSSINNGIPTCNWTNFVDGDLGSSDDGFWKGRSQGKDPFHLYPSDFVDMQATDGWDMFTVAGLDQGTSVNTSGVVELSVFYDTADSTTNLLNILITPDGIEFTGDEPEGLRFFQVEQLDAEPTQETATLTLDELKTLLETEMLADRVMDSPMYIGMVWEDIPVPTVDLGNGAVARVRVESAAEEEGAAQVMSFQQNIDEYEGLYDLLIGNDIEAGNGNIAGDSVESFDLQGFYQGPTDRQILLHFEGIENLIPENMRILNARFSLLTTPNPNSNGLGPYGVSQLLVPFDDNTTYQNSGGGLYFANGQADRPHDQGFIGTQPDEFSSADITRIVQGWVAGQPNHGLALSSGTPEIWQFYSSGVGSLGLQDPAAGPVIDVTMTELNLQSLAPITVINDTTAPEYDVFVTDGNQLEDARNADPNGLQLGGNQSAQLLVRPQFIFESQGGQVPDNAQIRSAKLVINTSSADFDQNAGTFDDFGVRPILGPWDPGAPNNQFNFGPFVDVTTGLVADSHVQLDITPIVEAWQQGQPIDGVSVASLGGNDSWVMIPNSAAPQLAPQLVIEFTHEVLTVLPTSFQVTRGTFSNGTLSDLRNSDNQDVSIRRSNSDVSSRTSFEVTGFSPHTNPVVLQVDLESSVFARSQVTAQIQLFDYQTQTWETIQTATAARFNDSTISGEATGDLSRFVEQNTLGMKARVEYVSGNPRQKFTSNVDAFSWTIE